MITNRRFRDIALGVTYDVGSRTLGQVPAIAEKWGTVDSITHRTERWRLVRQSALDPDLAGWIRYGEDIDLGRPPVTYKQVAVMSFGREPVDELQRRHPRAKHVGAYVLGETAIMVGSSDYTEIFASDPDNITRYAFGMRVGEGLFQGQPGLLLPNGKLLSLVRADLQATLLPAHEVHPTIPVN